MSDQSAAPTSPDSQSQLPQDGTPDIPPLAHHPGVRQKRLERPKASGNSF